MNLCPKDSVGLILWNERGQILMLERLKNPIGLAGVAGHVDIFNSKKESYEETATREWREETGAILKNMKLVYEDYIFSNDVHGGHFWKIFEVLKYQGEPRLMEPTKHGFVRWMSPQEIQRWQRGGKPTDPAWFKYIFPALAKKDSRYATLLA